jgi:hypothetical protein
MQSFAFCSVRMLATVFCSLARPNSKGAFQNSYPGRIYLGRGDQKFPYPGTYLGSVTRIKAGFSAYPCTNGAPQQPGEPRSSCCREPPQIIRSGNGRSCRRRRGPSSQILSTEKAVMPQVLKPRLHDPRSTLAPHARHACEKRNARPG